MKKLLLLAALVALIPAVANAGPKCASNLVTRACGTPENFSVSLTPMPWISFKGSCGGPIYNKGFPHEVINEVYLKVCPGNGLPVIR